MSGVTSAPKRGDIDVTRTEENRPIANPSISYRGRAYQTSVQKEEKEKEGAWTW